MIGMSCTCPIHPGEVRDARFAELDELIAAGYGSVSFKRIEEIRAQNGGVLPPNEDEPEDELFQFRAWIAAARDQRVTEVAIVYAAVQEGLETAPEIAAAVQCTTKIVAARLSALASKGMIESYKEVWKRRYYRATTAKPVEFLRAVGNCGGAS